MPSQWKKNKKRKGKPTPSPKNKETISKKIKQTDSAIAETQSESDYLDAQEQLEELREFHNLADSLPYLQDSQGSNDIDDSLNTKQSSTSQSSNMSSVAPADSVVSTVADESFPQSQSVLQGPAIAFSSTPVPSGPSIQPLGQVNMPIMQPQMVGVAPAMHNVGFPGQMPVMQPSLSDNDVLRIAIRVKEIMREEIESMVNIKINEATSQMKNDIKNLQDENAKLKSSILKLENRCNNNLDDLEQYGRRMNVRIAGINEVESEDTDQVVMDFAKSINVDIRPEDIDRCHRVKRRERESNLTAGPPAQGDARPREIIVKFTNSKARLALMKGRDTLRRSMSNIFINEDLTAGRKELTFECRKL
ncbi:MAG: hypothetical protein AB2693_23245 [Candidatus Thiodiazotropha sp.]